MTLPGQAGIAPAMEQRARHWPMIAACALLLTGAALGWTLGTPPVAILVILLAGLAAIATMALAVPSPEPTPVAPPASPIQTSITSHPDFAVIIDALPQPLLMIERERVIAANRAANQLLGDFIAGQDIRTALRHPAAVDRLTREAPQREQQPLHLTGLGRPDQRWTMRVAELPDDHRLLFLTDESDRAAVERMRADFVANASHELRTPLAAILGYVETLRDPDAGNDAALRERFLGVIDTEGRRMLTLVMDLLSISRTETTKHLPPETDLDAVAAVQRAVSEIRAAGDARAADITLDLPEAPLMLRADAAQWSQLLHNIIGNAMKYGRAGTPVAVRLAAEGGIARLSVSDQGDGIAPEHLPRLTERFYRVDSARSRALGGTGLGLAIVRHIVERHRGELDIASVQGEGTTVTVRMPLLR